MRSGARQRRRGDGDDESFSILSFEHERDVDGTSWRRRRMTFLQILIWAAAILFLVSIITFLANESPSQGDLTGNDSHLRHFAPFGGSIEEFRELPLAVKARHVQAMTQGRQWILPEENRLHGHVGLTLEGVPAWIPKGMPDVRSLNIRRELAKGGGFLLALSDALPLDRVTPTELEVPECKSISYENAKLDQASIIIVFYNEPASTLLRSVHSVLNYTPPDLLKEIILVDDGSTMDWIKRANGTLVNYLKTIPKTRLLRLPQRRGIVAARMMGIRAARAPIFVILDSHIECQRRWLEPLVARITAKTNAVLMPAVGGLDAEKFTYDNGGVGCTLGFLWKMIEHSFDPNEKSPQDRRARDKAAFVSSPTMAGGLFAANTNYFLNDLGGYDEGFSYWGTENLELSFRTWTCGGTLECAPCSSVYHIFRKGGVGYSSPPNATTINKLRLLDVYLDDYADLAWRFIGKPRVNYGDTSQLKAWRKEKNCHDFRWFLDNVYPESDVRQVPQDVPYVGAIRAPGGKQCVTLADPSNVMNQRAELKPCSKDHWTQEFVYFRNSKHITPSLNDENCLLKSLQFNWCHVDPEHMWTIQKDNNESGSGDLTIMSSGECLTVDPDSNKLSMLKCDTNNPNQRWQFDEYTIPDSWGGKWVG